MNAVYLSLLRYLPEVLHWPSPVRVSGSGWLYQFYWLRWELKGFSSICPHTAKRLATTWSCHPITSKLQCTRMVAAADSSMSLDVLENERLFSETIWVTFIMEQNFVWRCSVVLVGKFDCIVPSSGINVSTHGMWHQWLMTIDKTSWHTWWIHYWQWWEFNNHLASSSQLWIIQSQVRVRVGSF